MISFNFGNFINKKYNIGKFKEPMKDEKEINNQEEEHGKMPEEDHHEYKPGDGLEKKTEEP